MYFLNIIKLFLLINFWNNFLKINISAFIIPDRDSSSSSYIENDSIPNKQYNFISKEDMCFIEGKILYNNNCYYLNSKGPCYGNEKLVLDIDLASRQHPVYHPICKESACRENDLYWSKDNYCYDLESEAAKKLCHIKGTSPQIDMFGEGYCDCIQNPPHARMPNDKHESSPCYKLYTKANCQPNQILVENNNMKSTCITNHCHRLGVDYIKWPSDGKCYKLGTKGPCKKNQKFNILESTRKPGCKDNVESDPLFVIDVPCKTSHDGSCADQFNIFGADNFRSQLLRSAERARKRKKKSC